MKSLRYNIKTSEMKHIRNEIIEKIETYYKERDSMFEEDECYLFSSIPLENLIVERTDEDYFIIQGSYDEDGIPEYGQYLSRTSMFCFVEEWMFSSEKIKELIIMYNLIMNSFGWTDYEYDIVATVIVNYINFVKEKVEEGNLNTIPIAI